MFKQIISLFLFAVSFSSMSYASFIAPPSDDWRHIRTLNDFRIYHKANYTNIVNINGQKHLNTWAKYVARSTKPNMLYLKKDDYVLVQLQFNCKTNRYAILSGTSYHSQGRFSRASLVDQPQFLRIPPKSAEARIANTVCNKHNA